MTNSYDFEVYARKTVRACVYVEAEDFKEACELFSQMYPGVFEWDFVGEGLYSTEVGMVSVVLNVGEEDAEDLDPKDVSWRGREEDYAGDFYVEDMTPEQLALFD